MLARPWRWSRKLQAAFLAEFIGMTIFQIYGGNSSDSGDRLPVPTYTPIKTVHLTAPPAAGVGITIMFISVCSSS